MKIAAVLTLLVLGISQSHADVLNGNLHRRGLKVSKGGKRPKSSKSVKKPKGVGAVYTLSNAAANELIYYSQDAKTGMLSFEGSISTQGEGALLGGAGPEDPLASQDAVIVSGRCVMGVNAGSDTVASFKINRDGYTPMFASVVPSNGFFPVSLAARSGCVYVLNAGGNGTVSGYSLDYSTCILTPLDGSTVELPQDTGLVGREPPFFPASPAQIGFTPAGNLLVTIKALNGNVAPGAGSIIEIDVDYASGVADASSLENTPVAGTIPFSFAFDKKDNLILVEAFGLAEPLTAGTGAVTTYNNIDDPDSVPTLLQRESTGGTATCWVRYSNRGGCTFTTSNGIPGQEDSGSITALQVDDGEITVLEQTAATLDAPIDLDFSGDDKFLYALSSGEFSGLQPSIYAFKVSKTCGIELVQIQTDGLPDVPTSVNGVVGLAAY